MLYFGEGGGRQLHVKKYYYKYFEKYYSYLYFIVYKTNILDQ